MMARMRMMDDVTRVTLTSSEKLEQASGQTGGDGGDCRGGSDVYPKFEIVVFFKPPAATTSTTTTTSGVGP